MAAENYGAGWVPIRSQVSYLSPMARRCRAGRLLAVIAELLHTMRELHSRSNDGIDVRLLWSEHDDRVLVAVADSKTGEEFAVEVRDGHRALDVFHHPFAYAA